MHLLIEIIVSFFIIFLYLFISLKPVSNYNRIYVTKCEEVTADYIYINM